MTTMCMSLYSVKPKGKLCRGLLTVVRLLPKNVLDRDSQTARYWPMTNCRHGVTTLKIRTKTSLWFITLKQTFAHFNTQQVLYKEGKGYISPLAKVKRSC